LKTRRAQYQPQQTMEMIVRRASMNLPIRFKIILPFFVLLVFLGVAGTGLATQRLTDTLAAEFDASLLRTSLLANDRLELLEADRLSQLRSAADTIGVSEAAAAGDRLALARLLAPILANAEPTRLTARVLNLQGQQLLYLKEEASGPVPSAETIDPALLNATEVRSALAGLSDGKGERNLFLSSEGSGHVVYWISPLRTDSGRLAGAVLLGQSLSDIVAGIPDAAFYDSAGRVVGSAMAAAPSLPASAQTVTSGRTVRLTETRGGHSYGELFSDWTMRGRQFGYMAVVLNGDKLVNSVAQARLILVLSFTAAALLTLLIGLMLASRITRPLEQLVLAMRAVSAGDLVQRAPVDSKDEIGYLSSTFNEMTGSLQEKTSTLEETYFASMEALARAIDARDPYTFGHSSRVAAVSVEIATAMGLSGPEREALRRAALLHDIGKIGVEDRILRKPGPLDREETQSMRDHPQIGYQMLKGLRFLEPSLPGVRHHHERWDGAGYPAGLSGNDIPLFVRILTVADVFDALTSERPYRMGLTFDDAFDAIQADAGIRFDPAVVNAFQSRKDEIIRLIRKMGKVPALTAGLKKAS
jgi:putative nucleotidyltransferase with HDIG domain